MIGDCRSVIVDKGRNHVVGHVSNKLSNESAWLVSGGLRMANQ